MDQTVLLFPKRVVGGGGGGDVSVFLGCCFFRSYNYQKNLQPARDVCYKISPLQMDSEEGCTLCLQPAAKKTDLGGKVASEESGEEDLAL